MDFLIATNNQKKHLEMRRILSPLGIRVLTAKDLGTELEDVEETGATFEENAKLKAWAACSALHMPAIADDSGLCVDALDGAPGVYSARYAGEHGNDKKNNDKLLDALKDVPWEKRTGRYVSAICCAFPDGREILLRGECEGIIAYERSGSGGFGYDPLFLVGEKSFGELTAEEKDELSHRGKALRLLARRLPDYLYPVKGRYTNDK